MFASIFKLFSGLLYRKITLLRLSEASTNKVFKSKLDIIKKVKSFQYLNRDGANFYSSSKSKSI